jgi:hypothetical protein
VLMLDFTTAEPVMQASVRRHFRSHGNPLTYLRTMSLRIGHT